MSTVEEVIDGGKGIPEAQDRKAFGSIRNVYRSTPSRYRSKSSSFKERGNTENWSS